MLFLRRSLTGVLLMALTIGALAWAGQAVWFATRDMLNREARGMPAREIITAVNLVTLTSATEVPLLETFGEIASRRTLEVRAAAEGRILELSPDFENGGRVEQGEVLFRIDPAEAEAALAVARADLAEAEADLNDARTNAGLAQDDLDVAIEQSDLRAQALHRQTDLQDRGVGSAAAVETAALDAAQARQQVVSRRQALAQGEARVAAAETTVDRAHIAQTEAQRVLQDTEYRARFSGVLSEVSVVEGGLVSRNEALGQLVDPDALEVAFRLSTGQYARLLEGGRLTDASVTVVIDAGGYQLYAEGRIERESATVAEGQTGRLVFARLEEAPGFRPGDIVTVRIDEPALEGVARLPALALDGSGTVLAPDADMRLVEHPVELMRRQGDTVLVRAPDLEGAQVVAQRTPMLGAGLKVRPLQETPQPRTASVEAAEEELVELDPDRRAQLIAYVEGNRRMDDEMRARMIAVLEQDRVPAEMVRRLETRMGI